MSVAPLDHGLQGLATGNPGGVPDIELISNLWELMNKERVMMGNVRSQDKTDDFSISTV